jgi:YD repeat-containing protein
LPGDWKIVLKDGTIYSFPTSIGSIIPACQAALQIKDRYGNTIKLDRAPSTCVLTRITSTNGRYITVTSDANSRITQISDNIGRNVGYTYDAAGRSAR